MSETNDYVGYNPTQIKNLKDAIITAGNNCCQTLEKELSGVVNAMSKAWYAGEAVEYFTKTLQPSAAATGDEIRTKLFSQFIDNVKTSLDNWKVRTNNPNVDVDFDKSSLTAKIDITEATKNILEQDSDGFIGIKTSEFNAVLNQTLPASKQAVTNALNAEKGKLKADAAFLGEGQGSQIDAFFDRLLTAVDQLYDGVQKALDSVFKAHQQQNTKDAQQTASDWQNAKVTINTASN